MGLALHNPSPPTGALDLDPDLDQPQLFSQRYLHTRQWPRGKHHPRAQPGRVAWHLRHSDNPPQEPPYQRPNYIDRNLHHCCSWRDPVGEPGRDHRRPNSRTQKPSTAHKFKPATLLQEADEALPCPLPINQYGTSSRSDEGERNSRRRQRRTSPSRSSLSCSSSTSGSRPPSLEREDAFCDERTLTRTRHGSHDAADVAELYRIGLLYDDEHERGSGFSFGVIDLEREVGSTRHNTDSEVADGRIPATVRWRTGHRAGRERGAGSTRPRAPPSPLSLGWSDDFESAPAFGVGEALEVYLSSLDDGAWDVSQSEETRTRAPTKPGLTIVYELEDGERRDDEKETWSLLGSEGDGNDGVDREMERGSSNNNNNNNNNLDDAWIHVALGP